MSAFVPRPLITFDGQPPAPATLRADEELPDDQQVLPHLCYTHELTYRAGGVTYQRCGGGRRVIRKHRGGY